MIDIVIVDDQTFVHKTIETYLDSEPDLNIVGFAHDGRGAIERVTTLNPDVVLMDIDMPIMDGLTATKLIVEKFATTKILILTIQNDIENLGRALKSGAKGYWLKNTTAKELANAIRYVHKGYFQIPSGLMDEYDINDTTALNPESQDSSQLKSKLDTLELKIAQADRLFDRLKELEPQQLKETIADTVKQELNSRKERDTNSQYKIEKLQRRLTRLEKNLSLLTKIQLACNFILLVAVGYFIVNHLLLQ